MKHASEVSASHIIDTALNLDESLRSRFGAYEQPEMIASPFIAEGVLGTLGKPYLDVQILNLKHDNVMAAVRQSPGQILGMMSRQGEKTIIRPTIIAGATDENIRVAYLNEPLHVKHPQLTALQEIVLRAALNLGKEGVGSDAADQASPAAEPGHTYMGLKAITDPGLILAIQAGQHPVHEWTARGVAQTVTQRTTTAPGVFDVRLKEGGQRRIEIGKTELNQNSPVALVYHPSYRQQSVFEKLPHGLSSDRLALGVGIIAAQSWDVSSAENRLTDVLGRVEASGGA